MRAASTGSRAGEGEPVAVVARLDQHLGVAREDRAERLDPARVGLHQEEHVGIDPFDQPADRRVVGVLHQDVRDEAGDRVRRLGREPDLGPGEQGVGIDVGDLPARPGQPDARQHQRPGPRQEQRERQEQQEARRDVHAGKVPHPHPPRPRARKRQQRGTGQHGGEGPEGEVQHAAVPLGFPCENSRFLRRHQPSARPALARVAICRHGHDPMVVRMTRRAWRGFWRLVRRVLLAGAAAALLLVLAFRVVNPPTNVLILSERLRLGAVAQDWVALGAMSDWLPLAAAAAEDANFCLHAGSTSRASAPPSPTSGCAAARRSASRWRRTSSSGRRGRGCARGWRPGSPC
jgi:hypothetical protein